MTLPEIEEDVQTRHLDSNGGPVVSLNILLTETVRWPNAALLAIGLAKAGQNVSVVCPASHPLRKSRAVRRTFFYSGLRPLASLDAAIKATNPGIIIPCDDRAVQHLHELHAQARRRGAAGNELAALIEKSLGPAKSWPFAFARHDLLRIARAEGLRVPDTGPIQTAGDLKSWSMREAFPWVLKADGTYGGRGVKIAHTLKQAEQFVLELTRYYSAGRAIKRLCVNRDPFWLRPWWNGTSPAISIQAYIKGRPANSAVVCWKGKVLAGIGVEVVSPVGSTGPARVVRVVDNPVMTLSAERIAARLGLSGFFSLDFMIEDGSGLTYLIEMNPRPTRVSCLRLGKGRDLIGALCAQLSGQPYRETLPVTQKTVIAYFPDALDSEDELLESTFQDAPEGEPDLVREFLKPWPPRGLFWHVFNQADRMKMFLCGSDSSRAGSQVALLARSAAVSLGDGFFDHGDKQSKPDAQE